MAAMDPTTNGHDRTPHPHDVENAMPDVWHWSTARVIGMAAFLGLTIFWIWAFANRDSVAHPDEFDDPVFVVAAEALCADRQAVIAGFPLATAAEGAIERGLLVEQGTEQLARMVAELRSLPLPADPKGADGVGRWLTDYEIYLEDRRAYAEILATGDDPPFLISASASEAARVTDLLTTYAEVNEMSSCAPSGDV